MRLLFFLVWKNWASSPLRFGLTWAGVALGVAIVASIHVLDHNTILSQLERKRSDYGRVDFELQPLDPSRSLAAARDALARRPDIGRVGLLGNTHVETVAAGKPAALLSLYGLSPPGGDVFGHYAVRRGADLTDLDPEDQVLVAPKVAELLGLDVGSSFRVRALPRALETRCVRGRRVPVDGGAAGGEVRPERLVVQGVLEPFRLARRDAGLVIVGKFSLAAKLARAFRPLFQVKRAEGVDPDRIARDLRRDWFLEDGRTALIGEDADERAFRNGVKVLGCLGLILGMFVIFHTLSHSLAEKIRQVGILRCLGATPAQVARVFLADALVTSVLGTASGIAGGVLLARLLAGAKITTLGLGKSITTFEMPWTPLLAVAVLGVVVTMLGAAFPLLKARSLSPQRILYVRDLAPPADLMRGVNLFLLILLVVALPLGYLAMTPLLTGESKGAGLVLVESTGIVALFFAVLLLSPRVVRAAGKLPLVLIRPYAPLAAFLVRKTLLRAPGRVASSVCGLTLVALAMLGMRALTTSLRGEIRAFARRGLDSRLFLKTEGPVAEDAWTRLREIAGVRSVLPLSAVVALPFRSIGTDVAELAKPGGALDGRPDLLARMTDGRGLIVSTRLAELRGLAPGDRLPVTTGAGVVRYEVVAVSDREGFFPDDRAYAIADRRWFHDDFCLEVGACNRFALRLDPTLDPAVAAAAARGVLGAVSWARSGDEVLALHLADVGRDFRFFDILLWLLVLLAGVGQVNLITLTTIARSREIGVLRALGMTRGGFLQALLVEAVVVGFLAGLLAIAAGLPLSWVLVRGLEVVSGLAVPYVMPWGPALAVAGLSFGVSLLAALPPALRATQVAPAVSVRSTE